jgi:hypothetical protein
MDSATDRQSGMEMFQKDQVLPLHSLRRSTAPRPLSDATVIFDTDDEEDFSDVEISVSIDCHHNYSTLLTSHSWTGEARQQLRHSKSCQLQSQISSEPSTSSSMTRKLSRAQMARIFSAHPPSRRRWTTKRSTFTLRCHQCNPLSSPRDPQHHQQEFLPHKLPFETRFHRYPGEPRKSGPSALSTKQ